ncbi:hypothetical protein [Nostoc sp.]|uniref:hypothetical protein n=1 Tax=Nostoc sp. TaxID=1180 RepID=UPI002FFA658C
MPTLTLTEVKIRNIDVPLGAIVTNLNASQPIAPEVILQLKQALRVDAFAKRLAEKRLVARHRHILIWLVVAL